MPRFIYLLFVLLNCIVYDAKSQAPDLSKIKSDHQKIRAWLGYCDELRLNKSGGGDNYVLLQKAATQGLQLVPPTDDSDKAKFFLLMALGYYYQVKFDSAQYYFYQSLNHAEASASAGLIVDACAALIPINIQLRQAGKVDSCKMILQSILDTTHDSKILQDGYSAIGSYYQHKSYYSTAQDYIIKSLELRKKELDTTQSDKLRADYAIQCYLLSKLYQNSEPLFNKSLAILKEGQPYANSSPVVSTRYLSSFTEIYSLLGNIDSALHYKQLLDERTKNSPTIPSEVVSANMNIAKYYIDHQKPAMAYPYIITADTLASKSKSPILIYQAQLWNGRYLEQVGKFNEAIASLSRSLPVAMQINTEQYLEGLKYMAIAQKGAGNKDDAIRYYEQYIVGSDSLEKETVSRNFADQETRYQTNEKQNQIVSLDQKNKLNILELKQASNTRTLMILGLISLGIFSLLLYFIYRNKEKLNKVLNDRNTQLDAVNNQLSIANETKAKLFGIIGHDLRSPVSRIVQMLKIQKEKPELLDEGSKKHHEENLKMASENVLETMEDLLLWSKSQMQHFKPEFRNVLIADVVEKESSFLKDHADSKNIHIKNEIPKIFTLRADENFLEIIIRNLLQNAVKYSTEGSAILIKTKGDNSICINNEIAAINLQNLDTIFQNKSIDSKSNGLGLQIAKDLAHAIGANILFNLRENNNLETSIVWKNA